VQDGLSWVPVISMLAGLGLAVTFIRRQRTLADPMLDLRLFRNLTFNISLGANVLGVVVNGFGSQVGGNKYGYEHYNYGYGEGYSYTDGYTYGYADKEAASYYGNTTSDDAQGFAPAAKN